MTPPSKRAIGALRRASELEVLVEDPRELQHPTAGRQQVPRHHAEAADRDAGVPRHRVLREVRAWHVGIGGRVPS